MSKTDNMHLNSLPPSLNSNLMWSNITTSWTCRLYKSSSIKCTSNISKRWLSPPTISKFNNSKCTTETTINSSNKIFRSTMLRVSKSGINITTPTIITKKWTYQPSHSYPFRSSRMILKSITMKLINKCFKGTTESKKARLTNDTILFKTLTS